MDKQKQIEELAIRIVRIAGKGDVVDRAEALYDENCRVIPENAVVLTEKKDIQQFEWSKLVDKMGIFKLIEKECAKIRKETAEKFAERLKELEEALLDMVVQFCQMGEEGKLKHIFMSAEEQAFDVLNITYGENVADVYERFNKKWDRPIDEIAKEITEGKE